MVCNEPLVHVNKKKYIRMLTEDYDSKKKNLLLEKVLLLCCTK